MDIVLSDPTTNEQTLISASVDNNGNVYFTHNDVVSQVNLDNKNNIYIDFDNYTIIEKVDIPQNKFNILDREDDDDDTNEDTHEESDYFPEDADIEEINNESCDDETSE